MMFKHLSEPYDRAFAFSSLFISVAAGYCSIRWLALIMHINSVVSFLHWARWHDGLCWGLDIILSVSNIIIHLYMVISTGSSMIGCTSWCVAAVCMFMSKRWFTPRHQAMKRYRVLHLFPHGAFRFCGFWSVMAADGQGFNLWLSIFYWLTMILFGMPLASEKLPNCKGGVRQYLLFDLYF